jgi:CubicO group peptidase (beta-lactamase class C family)
MTSSTTHPAGSSLFSLLALSALFVSLLSGCTTAAPPVPSVETPGDVWSQWVTPADGGYDAEALATARRHADEVASGAVMVVEDGVVVAAWGDVERKLELHSVRKSLYAALYGIAAERGLVDLDATLADLGVDDLQGLTPEERTARLTDLLMARSGVYHPAAYAPSSQEQERPERGSHPPGTHWFYNNWDFNVAGALLERVSGRPLGDLFGEWIAGPIGMEDYHPGDVFEAWEPGRSRYPALTFRMSTRDLARFGLLWQREGRWGERQVIPTEWVRRASAPASRFEPQGSGYGMMWWTHEPGALPVESYPHLGRRNLVAGRGTGGQLVAVVPDLDLVYVHRGDTDHGRGVSGRDAWVILERIVAARGAHPEGEPPGGALGALAPVPLESQRPPHVWPQVAHLSAAERERLTGRYEIAPGVVARVYEWEGRLIGVMPGRGEAELFPSSATELFLRVAPGAVRLDTAADPADDRLVVTLEGREIVARRIRE